MNHKEAIAIFTALSVFSLPFFTGTLPLQAAAQAAQSPSSGPVAGRTGNPAKAADPSAAKRMVQADLPIGFANLNQLKSLLPDLVSKDGRYVILNSKRTIRITDYAENIEALRTFLKAMDTPPTNVRIEITHRAVNQLNTSGAQVIGSMATLSLVGGV